MERSIALYHHEVPTILEGRQTAIRRVIDRVAGIGRISEIKRSTTRNYDWSVRDCRRGLWHDLTHDQMVSRCPYGTPGDTLWGKEMFQAVWEDAEDQIGETRDWRTGKGYSINYPLTNGRMEL